MGKGGRAGDRRGRDRARDPAAAGPAPARHAARPRPCGGLVTVAPTASSPGSSSPLSATISDDTTKCGWSTRRVIPKSDEGVELCRSW
jgi:hypothetical protein